MQKAIFKVSHRDTKTSHLVIVQVKDEEQADTAYCSLRSNPNINPYDIQYMGLVNSWTLFDDREIEILNRSRQVCGL